MHDPEQSRIDLGPVPLAGQIAELERELTYRRKLYPYWIERGRLKPAEASYQIEALESAKLTLTILANAYDGTVTDHLSFVEAAERRAFALGRASALIDA